jgi:hypothetical protein
VSNFDFNKAYVAKENVFRSKLGFASTTSGHGTTVGNATEHQWRDALRAFLPARYAVGTGLVIDSTGTESQQIDVVIYDRQYSPLFEDMAQSVTIPVESVYAVFEVKQELDKEQVEYARNKVSSVRRMTRTSVAIPYAGGIYPPQETAAKPILGGILATRNDWASMNARAALSAMRSGDPEADLDFMVAANVGAVEWHDTHFSYAPEALPLAWLQYRLHQRLFALGTALALDIGAYWNAARLPGQVQD